MIERLSYQEYEARPGVRQSNLKHLAKSPAHYKQALAEHADTEALAFGRALHVAILEPHLFGEQFIVAPKIDKRTTAGKAAWADLQSSGKTVLSENDGAAISGIRASIAAHPAASKILGLCSDRETSIFWSDVETGVACKARLDGVCPALTAVVDLKSTKDASVFEFQKSLLNYGYHYQSAHTLAGCAALKLPFDSFIFIAVEKEPPYAVAVYQIDEDSLLYGALKVQELLRLYKACDASGIWPAYPGQIQKISLPAWATKSMKENDNGDF